MIGRYETKRLPWEPAPRLSIKWQNQKKWFQFCFTLQITFSCVREEIRHGLFSRKVADKRIACIPCHWPPPVSGDGVNALIILGWILFWDIDDMRHLLPIVGKMCISGNVVDPLLQIHVCSPVCVGMVGGGGVWDLLKLRKCLLLFHGRGRPLGRENDPITVHALPLLRASWSAGNVRFRACLLHFTGPCCCLQKY